MEESDGQGSEDRAGRAGDPPADAPTVLRRGEGPHRARRPAGRGERGGAVSARGPSAESVLSLEQGVSRSRQETAAGGHDTGGNGAGGEGAAGGEYAAQAGAGRDGVGESAAEKTAGLPKVFTGSTSRSSTSSRFGERAGRRPAAGRIGTALVEHQRLEPPVVETAPRPMFSSILPMRANHASSRIADSPWKRVSRGTTAPKP